MLKSSTGTERSDQMTTWTRTAVADALLTENSVVNPFGSLRSTSKYGSSSVAAGTSSIVQMTADAGATRASNPTNTRRQLVTRAIKPSFPHLGQPPQAGTQVRVIPRPGPGAGTTSESCQKKTATAEYRGCRRIARGGAEGAASVRTGGTEAEARPSRAGPARGGRSRRESRERGLRDEVVRGAGAVETDRLDAHRELAVGLEHRGDERLGSGRIDRRQPRRRGNRGVEVEVHPAEIERHRQRRSTDVDALRLGGERNEARNARLRRDRHDDRKSRLLLLVEDHHAFLAERIPRRTDAGHDRTGERLLRHLRVAPHQVRGAAREGAAVQVTDRERRGERLAVVDRGEVVVAAVEGVAARGRGRRVGGGSLDVDERAAHGEARGRVDDRIVAPEDVLVGGVTAAAGPEVADVAREPQRAVVDRVHRDVAAGDVVAQRLAGAQPVEDVRRPTG